MTISNVMAKQTPPSPGNGATARTATTSASGPILPPGVAIDQNLIILAGCAVLFGIYAIRRYDFIKKDSI